MPCCWRRCGRPERDRRSRGRQVPGASCPGVARRLASGPLPGLVLLAVLSFVPRQAAGGGLGPALVTLAAAVGLWLIAFPRLGTIPARDLITAGGVSGHAGAAV